jgi:hypothetical protein
MIDTAYLYNKKVEKIKAEERIAKKNGPLSDYKRHA